MTNEEMFSKISDCLVLTARDQLENAVKLKVIIAKECNFTISFPECSKLMTLVQDSLNQAESIKKLILRNFCE